MTFIRSFTMFSFSIEEDSTIGPTQPEEMKAKESMTTRNGFLMIGVRID